MDFVGLAALISVCANVCVSVWGFFQKRQAAKLAGQNASLSENLTTLADGVKIIEKAVADNKDALSKTAPGNAIAQTIQSYGPQVANAVDQARQLAHKVENDIYEARLVARENAEHAAEVAAKQAATAQ